MRVTKKALWESGGSLQRFGQLKLKGKSLTWKAGRIHRAATKEIERLQTEHRETLLAFGAVEIERVDRLGNQFKTLEITGEDDAQEFKKAWDSILAEQVEVWGDPFTPEELGEHLEALSLEDVGALSEWLIEAESVDKAQAAGA